MRVVRAARLHLKEGASDKVYEVDLVENDAVAAPERFLVNIRYGRRGAVLREGSKTPQPIAADAAAKVFDSVVVAKINGGYRRSDQPVASSVTGASGAPAEGRDGILLARLASCRRGLWPEKDRERLLWRIGQLRIAQAEPDLVAMVQDVGPSGASYALVWALARAVGGKAAPILEAVAAETGSVVIRDLARFALVSPLMGAQRRRSGDEADLPEAVARPARAGDADGLVAAMTALARGKPLAVGPALVALGRCAQDDVALHAGLCAALPLLPARPPYLIGLRRLSNMPRWPTMPASSAPPRCGSRPRRRCTNPATPWSTRPSCGGNSWCAMNGAVRTRGSACPRPTSLYLSAGSGEPCANAARSAIRPSPRWPQGCC